MIFIIVNREKVKYSSLRNLDFDAEFDTVVSGSVRLFSNQSDPREPEQEYSLDSVSKAILEKADELVKGSNCTAELKMIEKIELSPPAFIDAIKQGSVRLSFNIDNKPVWIKLIVVSPSEKEFVDLNNEVSKVVGVYE